MNARDAIKCALSGTQFLLGEYVKDLSDAELLERPVPKANHIAWQLGHLITSEEQLVQGVLPDAEYPDLPDGFADKYTKEESGVNPPQGFATKNEYVDLFNNVRGATIATVEKLSDDDLEKPNSGPMAPFAPKVGDLLVLVSNHTLMHAGQFTVLRRKLEKPIIF